MSTNEQDRVWIAIPPSSVRSSDPVALYDAADIAEWLEMDWTVRGPYVLADEAQS